MVSVGDHVLISFDVFFVTYDGATWVIRELLKYRDYIKFGKVNIEDNILSECCTTIFTNRLMVDRSNDIKVERLRGVQ